MIDDYIKEPFTSLKLVTGDELVGQIISTEGSSVVTLYRPLKVITYTDYDAVGLVGYMVVANPALKYYDFNIRHVLTMVSPMQKVVDYYMRVVDSYYYEGKVAPAPKSSANPLTKFLETWNGDKKIQ